MHTGRIRRSECKNGNECENDEGCHHHDNRQKLLPCGRSCRNFVRRDCGVYGPVWFEQFHHNGLFETSSLIALIDEGHLVFIRTDQQFTQSTLKFPRRLR